MDADAEESKNLIEQSPQEAKRLEAALEKSRRADRSRGY
jgi:hypothetical protein